MRRRSRKLMRVLAVAAAAAMLASALPATMAGAADGGVACRVYNVNKGISRNTVQRAVWAAAPGQTLLVQGTCRGTTLINKPLTISYMGWAGATLPIAPPGQRQFVMTPRGKVVSGSWRPAIVVDPGVDQLTITEGLRVIGGIVIAGLDDWQGDAKPVPGTWKRAAASPGAPTWSAPLSSCYVRNDESGDQFRRGRAAVASASAGDLLSLRGTCVGETGIDKDLHLSGWRMAISSTTVGGNRSSRDDSGPPTLTRVRVDDDVDDLVLKHIRVTNGFSIEDVEPQAAGPETVAG